MSAKIKNPARYSGGSHKHKPKGIKSKEFERVYWPYLPVLVIIFLILSLGFQSGVLQTALKHPRGKVLGYASSMSLNGLLSDTNKARGINGLSPLQLNGQLDRAAQAKVNDMAARNYWNHTTPDGNPPWVFVNAQGYNYQSIGENLATGFDNEQAAVNAWLASSSHRDNLMNPAYSDVGFGFVNDPNYTSGGGGPMTIVVAFYGQPKNSAQSAAVAQTGSIGFPSQRTSRAQVAFARLPFSGSATILASLCLFIAVAAWISKHFLAIRRMVLAGEKFTIKHPLLDVGLITIASLSYIMSQTAGFIR